MQLDFNSIHSVIKVLSTILFLVFMSEYFYKLVNRDPKLLLTGKSIFIFIFTSSIYFIIINVNYGHNFNRDVNDTIYIDYQVNHSLPLDSIPKRKVDKYLLEVESDSIMKESEKTTNEYYYK